MDWKFTLTDNTSGSPVETVIEEPIGWDNISIKLKRDAIFHGIFFDFSVSSLKFIGDGYTILKDAYTSFGIEADVTLKIEWACSNAYETLYDGRFSFDKYKEQCGELCYVELNIESTGCLMTFRNRLDQKVDLSSLTDFAGNALEAYGGLPKEISLPSKGIVKQDTDWLSGDDNTSDTYTDTISFGLGTQTVNVTKYLHLPFNNAILDEFRENGISAYTADYSGIDSTEPLDQFVCQEDADYIFRQNFKLYFNIAAGSSMESTGIGTCASAVIAGLGCSRNVIATPGGGCPGGITSSMSGLGDITFEFQMIQNGGAPVTLSSWTKSANCDTSWTVSDTIDNTSLVSMVAGDTIRFQLKFEMTTDFDRALLHNNDIQYDFTGTLYEEITPGVKSVYNVEAVTYTDPTDCEVFLINEALSRTTEAITDGCMKVYSDYFGRTDSQPYQADADGCGSLEVITKGLLIRRSKLNGNDPIMAVSFKDLFDALNCIHNIGLSIEENTVDGGEWVRIEPMEYFYQATVIFSALNIQNIESENNEQRLYSKFHFGYEKYEAEEFNGLDEFLTKREYRSTLTRTKNVLDRVCKFVASGYAIEVTRRLGNADSKDWRFDNDIFIICVTRAYPTYEVEVGNVTSPANIVDASTIYNYRISPLRNALRWMKTILSSYIDIYDANSKFVFTDGTANIYAEGQMLDTSCRLEAAVVSEKQDIDINVFDDVLNGFPVLGTLAPKFTYPMSQSQFKDIMANPLGTVQYQCNDGTIKEGYISELTYTPEEGKATFTLIPKFQ